MFVGPDALKHLAFLASEEGLRLMARLTTEDLAPANELRLLTALRKEYTGEQAGAGVEMARLQIKARDKFGGDAHHMFFTREALEQASDPLIRRYRSGIGNGYRLIDACCGIGSDSISFVRGGASVLGLDSDPVRVAIAQYNCQMIGVEAFFEEADVRQPIPEADIVFYDPARRDSEGQRLHDVERYEPPLSLIRNWSYPMIVVKLSPAVDLRQLTPYNGLVEFISVKGDLKEAVLWIGTDVTGIGATLLTGTEELHWGPVTDSSPGPISEPRGWLVEPDSSLMRAGLVGEVALTFGGCQLDPTIAYFTTDAYPQSPWLRAWKIVDWMPFNEKRLRAYLREHNVGKVTVKKRGAPMTPESVIPHLKLKGDLSRTLVLTQCQGKHIVMICEDIPAER
jgi:THUMP domain-containing protein/RNA cap guanine-N2 methyltransferase